MSTENKEQDRNKEKKENTKSSLDLEDLDFSAFYAESTTTPKKEDKKEDKKEYKTQKQPSALETEEDQGSTVRARAVGISHDYDFSGDIESWRTHSNKWFWSLVKNTLQLKAETKKKLQELINKHTKLDGVNWDAIDAKLAKDQAFQREKESICKPYEEDYMAYIQELVKDKNKRESYVGSNRQSAYGDAYNRLLKGNGSCFVDLPLLAVRLGSRWNSLLYADKINRQAKRGTTIEYFNKNKKADFLKLHDNIYGYPEAHEFPPGQYQHMHTQRYKDVLLKCISLMEQLKDMKTKYPNEVFDFYFMDDHTETVKGIMYFFNTFPENIPLGARIHVIQHEYRDENGFLEKTRFKKITSEPLRNPKGLWEDALRAMLAGNPSLHDLIKKGETKEIRQLFTTKGDSKTERELQRKLMNTADKDTGKTPLALAMQYGRHEIFQLLLPHSTEVDIEAVCKPKNVTGTAFLDGVINKTGITSDKEGKVSCPTLAALRPHLVKQGRIQEQQWFQLDKAFCQRIFGTEKHREFKPAGCDQPGTKLRIHVHLQPSGIQYIQEGTVFHGNNGYAILTTRAEYDKLRNLYAQPYEGNLAALDSLEQLIQHKLKEVSKPPEIKQQAQSSLLGIVKATLWGDSISVLPPVRPPDIESYKQLKYDLDYCCTHVNKAAAVDEFIGKIISKQQELEKISGRDESLLEFLKLLVIQATSLQASFVSNKTKSNEVAQEISTDGVTYLP